MRLPLPSRSDGAAAGVYECSAGSSLIVIGANGAGKTRFKNALMESLGDHALSLSALEGLYTRRATDGNEPAWSLRRRFATGIPGIPAQASTLELMLAQVMHDEMLNLLSYKLMRADNKKAVLRRTRLDELIELWQEVFPGNRILIESGRILFTREEHDGSPISSVRLSDGEKAVLYLIGGILYAPSHAAIFVEAPEMFLHPSVTSPLWNRLEALRPDCVFCYCTHDTDFASSRHRARVLWVRGYEAEAHTWDYTLMPEGEGISREIYASLTGSRKPVLFIEGDARSIDSRLYPLIFPDYMVRSLGSCNKVIEATRTFNDLSVLHKVDSMGIVDRDRRNDDETAYLRRKNILVPEVAEIENMFVLEDVVQAMARHSHKDADRAVAKVRKSIINLFKAEVRQQALMHVRHRVKRAMEYRVDARFDSIASMEQHLAELTREIAPRQMYEQMCRQFHEYADTGDYASVLKVFNRKSMLVSCNVAQLCGVKSRGAYIDGVIALLPTRCDAAEQVRTAIRRSLNI